MLGPISALVWKKIQACSVTKSSVNCRAAVVSCNNYHYLEKTSSLIMGVIKVSTLYDNSMS